MQQGWVRVYRHSNARRIPSVPRCGFIDLFEHDKGNNTTLIALPKSGNSILDTVIHGDCIEVLQGIESNSLDCCVVDPPYGLGEVKDIAGLLNAWIKDEDDSPFIGKSGFMGKSWDAGVPSPRYWREVYRVLKPGAHILCFAGTRTLDLMALSLRLSGFQYRETLQWLYGSGFPKSTAIDKQIDKLFNAERKVVGTHKTKDIRRNVAKDAELGWDTREGKFGTGAPTTYMEYQETEPATPEARQHRGWGSALKPAWEPILLFRKPLEGTLASNTLTWGVGGLHIDACRVGLNGELKTSGGCKGTTSLHGGGITQRNSEDNTIGRFPSNLLLSHSIFCVPTGTKRVRVDEKPHSRQGTLTREKSKGWGMGNDVTGIGYADPEGYEQVEAYQCHESCPIAELDRQSGVRKSGDLKPWHKANGIPSNSLSGGKDGSLNSRHGASYGDQGGASRYFQRFPVDEPDFIPFTYAPKASRSERNQGCEGLPEVHPFDRETSKNFEKMGSKSTPSANSHPTVKPQQLMRWLIRLITPPNGVVLDCFGGSGSTAVAAIQENVHYILIEAEQEYVAIANARINHAKQHTSSNSQTKEAPHKPTGSIWGSGRKFSTCPEHGVSYPSGSNAYSCGCKIVYTKQEAKATQAKSELWEGM